MNKKITLSVLLLFACTTLLTAQVGIGTTTPAAGALLDIHGDNGGIVIPRVELVETTDQAPIIGPTPVTGLMVYNSAPAVNDVSPGFYYWNGSAWERMASGSTTTLDFEDTTFLDTPLFIDSNNGDPVGGLLYSHSINLTKTTLVEIKLHFDLLIRRFDLSPPSNGNPILHSLIVTSGDIATGTIIVNESKSFTSSAATGAIYSGAYSLGGSGYVNLPAGNHTLNVYVFGAGGGSNGFDLTYYLGNDARFQVIYHN